MRSKVYHVEAETNDRRLPGDIFNLISLNENISILIKISLKFVLKDPYDFTEFCSQGSN